MLFVMKKYNPQRVSAFSVLEEVQPVVEQLKVALLELTDCSTFTVPWDSIETAPETELYGSFAGWSLSFIARE